MNFLRAAEQTLLTPARRVFDIQQGEGQRASLMLAYNFLIITSLLVLKPVSTALFLAEFGAARLPYVFILVAIFAAVITSGYSKHLSRARLDVVIIQTLKISIGLLLVLWILIVFDLLISWTLFNFYIFVAIFAVTATSQFWILANFIFNPREAKRLFGFIGAGGIAGGIFGGYLTSILAPLIGSENLILVCAALLAACIALLRRVLRKTDLTALAATPPRDKSAKQRASDHPFALIRRSRHLTYLASIIGISVLVAKLVEYQFSAIALSVIADEDRLTAFFGFWLSNMNFASLLIQLFITRRVVGVFGVGTSLFFLPVGILLGAVAVLINPALWSAIGIKICDGSLKQSINKAGIELLALPIPVELKKQAKAFIDVFVDSLATGIGGLLLLAVTLVFGFSARQISLCSIPLIAVWLYLTTRVRREYIQSLRAKVTRTKDAVTHAPLDLKNESVFGGLIKVLQSGTEAQIVDVLKMVMEIRSDRLLPCFRTLLHHPSAQVRLWALRNLYFYHSIDLTEDVERCVADPDGQVKVEALRVLFKNAGEKGVFKIQEYLVHKDYRVRGAALLCAAREAQNNPALKKLLKIGELTDQAMKQLPALTDKEQLLFAKRNCARIIGEANMPQLHAYLHILLKDPSPEVVKEAIRSAGETKSKEFLPTLFRYLGQPQFDAQVRGALVGFGPSLLEILNHVLNDAQEDFKVRLQLPRVIAELGTQKAVDVLLQNLRQGEAGLRYEVIKALNRLRLSHPELRFRDDDVANWILNEARNYLDTLAVLHSQIGTGGAKGGGKEAANAGIARSRARLISALEEKLDRSLEHIFRLLGLKYPPDEMYDIYLGIRGDKADLRINAVEFLDNVLDFNLKRVIIPIVETTLVHTLIENTLARFNLNGLSEFDCLVKLLSGEDDWVKACALDLIVHLHDNRFLPYIGGLMASRDPMVRERATATLRSLGYFKPESK